MNFATQVHDQRNRSGLHGHRGPAAPRSEGAVEQRDATKLISDLPARGNPRVRLARDQCIPPGALLTGGLGKARI